MDTSSGSDIPVQRSTDFGTSQSHFTLTSRNKIWVIVSCITVMLAASIYAVIQPVQSHLPQATRWGGFWYPIETNPYARLPGVSCGNEYACRLNSVAAQDQKEVWVVGNVGLVLHRKPNQTQWEQLAITLRPKIDSVSYPAAGKPAPAVRKPESSAPAGAGTIPPQTTSPKTPAVKPDSSAPAGAGTTPPQTTSTLVPQLLGLTLEQAQKMLYNSKLQLQVQYEKGSEASSTQQAPPTNLRVLQQSPAAGTKVEPGSTIIVTVGPARASSVRLVLDSLVPTVYASEKENPSQPPRRQELNTNPRPNRSTTTVPTSNRASQSPDQAPARTDKRVQNAAPSANQELLDDDLISVTCPEMGSCVVLGRSGRLYTTTYDNKWTFVQGQFVDEGMKPVKQLALLYTADGKTIVASQGHQLHLCVRSSSLYVCHPEPSAGFVGNNNEAVLKAYQIRLPRAPRVHERALISNTGETLAVGDSGFISTGRGLNPISGTSASLRSFAFSSSLNGWIVGDHGIILSSTDGGSTWSHETQGPEGKVPNHRIPALWYWALALILVAACSFAIAAPEPAPATEFSVADWTVTDAPLKPGDLDALDFLPMALGLSRFIRNPKTQPPVTIAIEGQWGEGKSSLMGMLRGDLKKSRFRPVWFNAWHHQSEEQLLAALLEHIRKEAMPPWWHIDNWIFRAKLVKIRFRQKWPLMLGLILAAAGSLTYELTRHGFSFRDLDDSVKQLMVLIRYLLPWSNQTQPPDLAHLGIVATIVTLLAAIYQKAKAFGIDPAKVTDNLRNAATIKSVKPEPGIRQQFAREFADICRAWSWGSRRVIIFIDDLDRCRPESVVTVLESINFLTTAGDCVIVMGIAQEPVTHCVGLSFKDIADSQAAYAGCANTDQEKARARYAYGKLYIRKLVNIFAPLPKTTEEQRRRVLEARASAILQEKTRKERENAKVWRVRLWNVLRSTGTFTLRTSPLIALAAAFCISIMVGYRQGMVSAPPTATTATTANPLEPKETPASQGTNATSSDRAKRLEYPRPTQQGAILAAAKSTGVDGVGWAYGMGGFLMLLPFGFLTYVLSARSNQDAQNSPEFETSLALWGNYIVGVCDTPREIKRALNDLRFQAMTRRNNGPSSTRGEQLVRIVRQMVTGQREEVISPPHVDEAALPPLKALHLAALEDSEARRFLDPDDFAIDGSDNFKLLTEIKIKHLAQFHRWLPMSTPKIDNHARNEKFTLMDEDRAVFRN